MGMITAVASPFSGSDPAEARWTNPDEALLELYAAHYKGLVRLATFLLKENATPEEIVQDAFVAMHASWRRLRDPDRAEAYLRQAVVNRCRSGLRRRRVAEKYAPKPMPDAASAEHGALGALDRASVVQRLRALPTRQREVLVLRYYGQLSEAEIAATLGISQGAVKSHASRGMTALRASLEHLR
jgi:RNA polymerase sigma-70 factor (sigma-E family)